MPSKGVLLFGGYLVVSVLLLAFAGGDVAFIWIVGMPIAGALAEM